MSNSLSGSSLGWYSNEMASIRAHHGGSLPALGRRSNELAVIRARHDKSVPVVTKNDSSFILGLQSSHVDELGVLTCDIGRLVR